MIYLLNNQMESQKLHINDLPTQLERNCAIFADDTTVSLHAASSDSDVQEYQPIWRMLQNEQTVGAC